MNRVGYSTVFLQAQHFQSWKELKNSERTHFFPLRKEIPWSFGNLLYHLVEWTEVEIMGEFMPLFELFSFSHLLPYIKKYYSYQNPGR